MKGIIYNILKNDKIDEKKRRKFIYVENMKNLEKCGKFGKLREILENVENLPVHHTDFHLVFIGFWTIEEYLSNLLVFRYIDIGVLHPLFQASVFLVQLQTFLQTDEVNPGVEINTDHHANIHKLFPCHTQGLKHVLLIDDFHLHILVHLLSRDLEPSRDGQVPYQQRCTEKNQIEIL